MSFKRGKGLEVTYGIIKGIQDSWCTYTEGTRAENKLHSRNSM